MPVGNVGAAATTPLPLPLPLEAMSPDAPATGAPGIRRSCVPALGGALVWRGRLRGRECDAGEADALWASSDLQPASPGATVTTTGKGRFPRDAILDAVSPSTIGGPVHDARQAGEWGNCGNTTAHATP